MRTPSKSGLRWPHLRAVLAQGAEEVVIVAHQQRLPNCSQRLLLHQVCRLALQLCVAHTWGGKHTPQSARAAEEGSVGGKRSNTPRRWHPAPTAPEDTNTTLWPASCSAATASHSLVICRGVCEDASKAWQPRGVVFSSLTCDKCMQFLSARNRLEVPTLMTTVTPVTWPARSAPASAAVDKRLKNGQSARHTHLLLWRRHGLCLRHKLCSSTGVWRALLRRGVGWTTSASVSVEHSSAERIARAPGV
jgi:hypothetical protein